MKGSSAYWFQKRSQLYTWINHHVEKGNGAPNFFITLSCAEYFWPDIIALIKERMETAGLDATGCYFGSPQMTQLIDDYSIVVQEYFQKRVEAWLQAVGKTIFGIQHYWVRYEFAPGRGQIHAHLLAIANHNSIHEFCHDQLKANDPELRAEMLGEWAEKQLGLTASVDQEFESMSIDKNNTPCSVRYTNVADDPEAQKKDLYGILKYCQTHKCSEFCLRETPNNG